MEKFERIPEVTEHVLAGLTADEGLKHRIFLAASAPATKKKYPLRTVVSVQYKKELGSSKLFPLF